MERKSNPPEKILHNNTYIWQLCFEGIPRKVLSYWCLNVISVNPLAWVPELFWSLSECLSRLRRNDEQRMGGELTSLYSTILQKKTNYEKKTFYVYYINHYHFLRPHTLSPKTRGLHFHDKSHQWLTNYSEFLDGYLSILINLFCWYMFYSMFIVFTFVFYESFMCIICFLFVFHNIIF